MISNILKSLMVKVALSTVVALGVGAGSAVAAEPIKMAITDWADVLATANVAKYVLETKLNQPVKFVMNRPLGGHDSDQGLSFRRRALGSRPEGSGWLILIQGSHVWHRLTRRCGLPAAAPTRPQTLILSG